MNQTTNYGFNVPIGSDVVNPLVQDFPNWTSLDTILKGVANSGIGTATHTKAGTVHSIALADDDIPVFRFQATGDFNLNDSVVVDGTPVSALTVSGESLPDGAFVIGSMVLCELRDTLLTVYTAGTDANTLEGHSASYFATASDLNTVDGKVDANKILIDNLEDEVVYALTLSVADQLTYDNNIQCGVATHDISSAPGYPQNVTIIGVDVVSSNISTYDTDLVEAYVLADKKTLKLCHRGAINSSGIANTTVRIYYKP